MALLLLLVFTVAMFGGTDAAWCVCNSQMTNTQLQKTLDYACGAGADCAPILQNGACYNPNTVVAHCSYAANSYYQRKNQAPGACDFTGSAQLISTDPSGNGCTYPATPSAAGTSSTPTSTTTSISPPSTFTPTTGITGTTGGVLGGLGPSGTTSYGGTGSEASLFARARMPQILLIILVPVIVTLKI